MDFGPFVNATWASPPKPFQWARRLVFRRALKVEVPKDKSAQTAPPVRDDPSEASVSQQAMNSNKMINTQDDTTPPATKRAESTVWGVAWVAFLLSIIPVVVLTLSCLLTPRTPSFQGYMLTVLQSWRWRAALQLRRASPTFTCTAWTASPVAPVFASGT